MLSLQLFSHEVPAASDYNATKSEKESIRKSVLKFYHKKTSGKYQMEDYSLVRIIRHASITTAYVKYRYIPRNKNEKPGRDFRGFEINDTEGEFFVVRMRGYLSGAAASNNNKDRFEYGRLLFNEGRSSSNNELMQAGVYLLSQAAERDHLKSIVFLINIMGTNNTMAIEDKKYVLVQKAARLNHPESIKLVAEKLLKKGKVVTAVKWLEKGIALGHPELRILLANIYLDEWQYKEGSFKKATSLIMDEQKNDHWKAKQALAELYGNLQSLKPLKSIAIYEDLIAKIDDIPFTWNRYTETRDSAKKKLLEKFHSDIKLVRTLALTTPKKYVGDDKIIEYIKQFSCSNCRHNGTTKYPHTLLLYMNGFYETLQQTGALELRGSRLFMKLVQKGSRYVYQVGSLNSESYCFAPYFLESIGGKHFALLVRGSMEKVGRDGGLKVELPFRGRTSCTPYQKAKVDMVCEINLVCKRSMSETSMLMGNLNVPELRCNKNDTKKHKLTKKLTLTIGTNKTLEESLHPTIWLPKKYDGYLGSSRCYKRP